MSNTFHFSNEIYKKHSILDSDFEKCNLNFKEEEEIYDISLFDKRTEAANLISINEDKDIYSIENILSYDNTNKNAQFQYLKLAVNELKKKDINKDKKLVLIEKIYKAGIICDEVDYNKAIFGVSNEYASNIKYINYKKTLITALENILNKKKKNIYMIHLCSKKNMNLIKRAK